MLRFVQAVDNDSKVVLKCHPGALEIVRRDDSPSLVYFVISRYFFNGKVGFTKVCINAKLCLDGHEVEKMNV